MTLVPGQQIGPYTIERALKGGRGGFAQVVLARPTQGHGQLVALKVQRTSKGKDSQETDVFADSLSNEVEMLRRVRHPGIMRIIPIPLDPQKPIYLARDLNLPGAPWYFAMEYLAGGTLGDLLQRKGPLPVELAIETASQVCDVLEYLHANGMSHLDVKPHNIMFRTDPLCGAPLQAVLVDFGMAQHAELESALDGLSVEYVAPERLVLLDGEATQDDLVAQAAADVYSLGATLFCMLTGQPPFTARTRPRLVEAIRTGTPEIGDLYAETLGAANLGALRTLVMSMLDRRPASRPTYSRISQELDRIAPPPRVWQTIPHEATRDSDGNNRKITPHLLGAAAALLVVGALALLAMSNGITFGSVRGWLAETWAALESRALAEAETPTRQPTSTPAPSRGLTVIAASESGVTPTMVELLPTSIPAAALFRLVSPAEDDIVTTLPFDLIWEYDGALGPGEEFQVTFCWDAVCGFLPQYTKAQHLLATPDGGSIGWPNGWRVAIVDAADREGEPLVVGPLWPLTYDPPTPTQTSTPTPVPLAVPATLTPAPTLVPTVTPTVSTSTTGVGANSLAVDQPPMNGTMRISAFPLKWFYPPGLKQDERYHLTYMREDGQNVNVIDTYERRVDIGIPATHYGYYKWNVAVQHQESDGTWTTVAQSDWWWMWVDPNAPLTEDD